MTGATDPVATCWRLLARLEHVPEVDRRAALLELAFSALRQAVGERLSGLDGAHGGAIARAAFAVRKAALELEADLRERSRHRIPTPQGDPTR